MNTMIKHRMVLHRFCGILLTVAAISSVSYASDWGNATIIPGGRTSPTGPAMATYNNKLYCAVKCSSTPQIAFFSSSDGVTWSGTTKTSVQSTSAAPALAAFNNTMYSVYKSNDTSNTLFVTYPGADNLWNGFYQIPGKTTGDAPSLAVLGNKLFCAYKENSSSNRIFVTYTTDGQNWSNSTIIPAQTTPFTPSLAVFNNRLYCIYRANSTAAIIVTSSSDGVNWAAAYVMPGGGLTPAAPAALEAGGKLYCLVKGTDSKVYVNSSDNGVNWAGWASLGAHNTKASPAMALLSGKLYGVYTSNDGSDSLYLTRKEVSIDETLDVPLIGQQTNMWCWAASGEMIMRYLGGFITQCVEANNRFNRNDCCNNFQNCVIGGWPEFDKYGFRYLSTEWDTALTFDQLKTEFENNRPIGFCWGWTGGGGHYMVATGVHQDGANGERYVHVNDPWPWNADKTVGGGTRVITYAEFVAAPDHTTWRNDYDIVRN